MLTPILNFLYFQTWPQIWTFSSGKQTSEFRMWQLFLGTSLTELETNIAVANRQAKLTTPPFTATREACLVINQLSGPPSGSCRAQRAGSQGGLGGGRGAAGEQPGCSVPGLYHQKQTRPALLRLVVLSEHLQTVSCTKSALSSHKTSQPAENRGTKRTK